uniref:Si:dkey-14o18.2 n=2 Tax=Tetraodon nigroviridis TaxID=99883 RepID=H3DLF7_TETNG
SLMFCSFLTCAAAAAGSLPGIDHDYGISPKFVCTPIPPEADPSCYSSTYGAPHEAKATILHLRESLVRQKETILDQRETIRELTAKLTLCEGFGGHHSSGGHRPEPHHRKGPAHAKHGSFSPEQTGKTLQTLKERLENLQEAAARNSSSSYSSSLRELLQRKIAALEEQLHSYHTEHHDYDGGGRHDDHHGHGKLEAVLGQLHHSNDEHGNHQKLQRSGAFLLDFPMRTNYLYARMRRSLLKEIFALTICLWVKPGSGPGLGTPFSYAVPGQANELVLIEWGGNPMELLISDEVKAVTLPVTMTDGKWHHVCVTWSTRDGAWEVYQDGVRKGSGQNLAPWHAIKAGGVFILGQEQDTMGGRFDVTQSFTGQLSDLQFWSRVLTTNEIHKQATCASHLTGDVVSWAEESVELHGGLAELPFDPCH